jgi:hypothetical protein
MFLTIERKNVPHIGENYLILFDTRGKGGVDEMVEKPSSRV